MKKKNKPETKDFDQAFDDGEALIDLEKGVSTEGLSKIVKLPPLTIPAWLALEIEKISKLQANSKASVVRQLLVEAIQAKKRAA